MEDLWLRQSVHGWVLFLGIKSVYSDKSERNYRGKCFGWPVASYGGVHCQSYPRAGQLYSWFSVPFSDGSLPLSGSQCFTHPLYHPSISNGHLTAAVHHYFGSSLASITHRAYSVGQNHFITFCLLQGIIGPSSPLLLASEITLIYFAVHLAKTICYNTIKLYLFAVQDLHRQHGFPLTLCKMYRLQKVLTGIKRSQMLPYDYSNFEFHLQLFPASPTLQCRPYNAVGCFHPSIFWFSTCKRIHL